MRARMAGAGAQGGRATVALLAALGAGTAALAALPLAGRGAAAASWLVTLVVLTGLCLVAAERCVRRLGALRLGVLVSLVALGCACRAPMAEPKSGSPERISRRTPPRRSTSGARKDGSTVPRPR